MLSALINSNREIRLKHLLAHTNFIANVSMIGSKSNSSAHFASNQLFEQYYEAAGKNNNEE